MTSRRLFLAQMAGLAGSTLLAKADYTKPLSLPVVLPRVEDYKGDSGKIVLDFSAIDFDRLLYCISEVETGHKDDLIGPSGERSKYQLSELVWSQHGMAGMDFTAHCHGKRAERVAMTHLRWLAKSASVPLTPIFLARCWRAGLSGATRGNGSSYARRVINIYESF